jgi:AcrR family transcriptional regulator
MERDRLETPRRGRPRDAVAHEVILGAAVTLCREVGYDSVSMEGIAARAGVGKATLYRWWPSKEILIAEAIRRIVAGMAVPDTGTTEGDVLALMYKTVQLYADPATLPLLSGLVAAMHRSEPIATAVRGGFWAAWLDCGRAVLNRGVARGDLRVDVELALDLLAGPLFYRAVWEGQPVDDDYARAVVRVVLRGMSA